MHSIRPLDIACPTESEQTNAKLEIFLHYKLKESPSECFPITITKSKNLVYHAMDKYAEKQYLKAFEYNGRYAPKLYGSPLVKYLRY